MKSDNNLSCSCQRRGFCAPVFTIEELLKLAKAGDSFALEQIFKALKKQIRLDRYFDPETLNDKKDIEQLAFMGIWESVKQFNGKGRFESYAVLKTRRFILDNLRRPDRVKKQIMRYETLTDYDPIFEPREFRWLCVIARIERLLTHKKNRSLKKLYYAIKSTVDLGLTDDEIAKKLKLSPSSVSIGKESLRLISEKAIYQVSAEFCNAL